jgi:predicted branched-subunit amino acid permease
MGWKKLEVQNMTRRKEIMIVLAGAVLTTVVVAVVKRLGFEIAAALLAGVGTAAVVAFVIVANMQIMDRRSPPKKE